MPADPSAPHLVLGVDGEELAARWYTEHGYCVDPFGLVQALADSVRRNGGTILPQRVLNVEMDDDKPRALVTAAGRHEVDAVVVAAGAWSHQLARMFGHKVPLETQRSISMLG